MRDERHILFYDGTCGICSRSVRFILKNESDERINFAALQSDFSSEFLGNFDIESSNLTTLYFYSNGIIYSKSRALFALLPFLKWYYSFFYSRYSGFKKSWSFYLPTRCCNRCENDCFLSITL